MVMQLNRDIVINDEELETINTIASNFSKQYTEKLSTYLKIMQLVTQDGIPSGTIHDNLILFTENAAKLKDEIEKSCTTLIESNKNMISELDRADKDFTN